MELYKLKAYIYVGINIERVLIILFLSDIPRFLHGWLCD